ncbi:GNT-I family-domain-containing protein [Baffinella frigidus]|nr:GNT-I family-domain-containing protein [Cryptophyta sp. CCMP2293]
MRLEPWWLLLVLAVIWSVTMMLYSFTLPDHNLHTDAWKPKHIQGTNSAANKAMARAEKLAASQSQLLLELGATPAPLRPGGRRRRRERLGGWLSDFSRGTTAIVVLACQRPEYLTQTMESLLKLPGVEQYHVIISQDGTDVAVKALAETLTQKYKFVQYVNNDMRQNHADKRDQASMHYIADHYKFVFTHVFERASPAFKHAILIEEDMVLSPDFLALFEATAPVLDADPSLYCVSSWNDNGYVHMELAPSKLFRSGFFPGLGWMLRRDLWVDELRGKWPMHSWDHWMRVDAQAKGRDCVVPELSRNHNIGAKGATVSINDFRQRLQSIAFNQDPSTDFGDLSYLHIQQYEGALRKELAEATPALNTQQMITLGGKTYRMGYVREEWKRIATSLGIYPSQWPRAAFHRVTRLKRDTNVILLYDRRLSDLAPDPILPPASFAPSAAPQGSSCVAHCQSIGKRCDNSWFDFVNSCEQLGKAFSCAPHGCGYEVGEDIPVYVSDKSHPTFGTCLITDAIPHCEAKHRSTSRLCPCG